MLKKFNPITEDFPELFCENVFLFTDSGKVLTGRHNGDAIKNIFSLIDGEERSFVYDNMFFAGLHPLLLVESSLGPIFIDDSLFGSYRLLIAILPHFEREVILALVKKELRSIVLPSPRMKAELGTIAETDVSGCESFVERLSTTHRGAYYYRVHGRTNGEISIMMSEIAYDYARFCGCELDFSISGVGLFEMKNDLCIDSYIFALTSLLLAARNYSRSRRAKMDVFFDDMGVCFEFGFEIATQYRSQNLLYEASELKNFKFWASSRLFDCDYYQNERAFAIRGYPWFKHPNSADLKEKRKEFIYNL